MLFAVYIVLMLFFPASASPISGESPRDALPSRAEGEAETVPGATPGHQQTGELYLPHPHGRGRPSAAVREAMAVAAELDQLKVRHLE